MVVATPPLFFYLGLSSSNALGMMVATVILLVTPWSRHSATPSMRLVSTRQYAQLSLFVSGFVVLHLIAVSVLVPIDFMRSGASLIPLVLLLVGGSVLANAFIGISARRLHSGMLGCFAALCAVGVLGATQWGPPTLAPPWHNPVFPFTEPSHFAFAFIPVLMYACVSSRGMARVAYLAIGLACSAFIQSLTLAVGCVLIAAVSFRIVALVILAAPLTAILSQLDLTYFTSRLDFSEDASNLSTLFYLQGWQMLQEGLERSAWVGVGFQQMGVHGTNAPIAEIVSDLYGGEEVNVLGTLFLFAKLGSEFGVFGAVLALAYVFVSMRSMHALRQSAFCQQHAPPLVTLARCVVASYLIELFVRSAGLFTGGAVTVVAALWILTKWRSDRKRQTSIFPEDANPTLALQLDVGRR
jgi:hypothetical protein